ncbi:MAG TPA: transporter substrate-binding domain-containing protein [Mycobacteriales bacterium]
MTTSASTHRPLRRLLAVLTALLAAVALAGCAQSANSATTTSSRSLLDQVKEKGVLKVGIRADNPPHSFIDPSGRWVGFDVDIANAIAKDWGVRLEPVKVDELTRISFLDNGRIDLAVASMSKTRKRAEKVDFSQTYFFSSQSFLVRSGQVASFDQLVGKRVGASRGSSSIGNWTTWLSGHGHAGTPDIIQFGDKQAAAAAVKQGSIAGWAEDYEVLAAYAKKTPGLSVLNDAGGIGVKRDGIAMHKNDSALRLAVDLALQDIQRSGDYDKIYDTWFGASSATPVPRQGQIEVWPNG